MVVDGTLNMNGNSISCDGGGFRGAIAVSKSGCTESVNTFRRPSSSDDVCGPKGEGAAGTPYRVTGALGGPQGYSGGDVCQGAPANAGGGGNGHNSPGGGGANANRGGDGGSSNSFCTGIFEDKGGRGGVGFSLNPARLYFGEPSRALILLEL